MTSVQNRPVSTFMLGVLLPSAWTPKRESTGSGGCRCRMELPCSGRGRTYEANEVIRGTPVTRNARLLCQRVIATKRRHACGRAASVSPTALAVRAGGTSTTRDPAIASRGQEQEQEHHRHQPVAPARCLARRPPPPSPHPPYRPRAAADSPATHLTVIHG